MSRQGPATRIHRVSARCPDRPFFAQTLLNHANQGLPKMVRVLPLEPLTAL